MLQDEDEDELTEYEEWFLENEFYFPIELRSLGMNSMELELFYQNVYKSLVADVSVAVHRVMLLQHPWLCREIRPRLIEKINMVAPRLAHDWATQLFSMMYYVDNGFDLREKYDCFDFWKKNNMDPDHEIKRFVSDYDLYEHLSDDELDYIEDDYKRDEIIGHRALFRERAAVYDAFMLPALKHYGRILDIQGDAWVVLAGLSGQFITEYVERASDWDIFFKLGFPEEYLDMDPMQYHQLMMDTLQRQIYWCLRCGEKLAEEDRDRIGILCL